MGEVLALADSGELCALPWLAPGNVVLDPESPIVLAIVCDSCSGYRASLVMAVELLCCQLPAVPGVFESVCAPTSTGACSLAVCVSGIGAVVASPIEIVSTEGPAAETCSTSAIGPAVALVTLVAEMAAVELLVDARPSAMYGARPRDIRDVLSLAGSDSERAFCVCVDALFPDGMLCVELVVVPSAFVRNMLNAKTSNE